MGILNRLFGSKKQEDKSVMAKEFKKQIWDASPKSKCMVCGKEARGLSGGIVAGSGEDFVKAMLENNRYLCPKCGFVSCFNCSADTKILKVVCRKCKSEMKRV